MLRAIILIAAIVVIGFVLAPRITAHELNDHGSDDTASWTYEVEHPRFVSVTVRGVRPTYDDRGQARPAPWTNGRHW